MHDCHTLPHAWWHLSSLSPCRRPSHVTPLEQERLLLAQEAPLPPSACSSHHHHHRHQEQQQQQQPAEAAQAEEPRELCSTRIFAAGICCPMESPLVHRVLESMPGVHSVEVSVMAQTVMVKHDPGLAPPGALVAALNGVMLEASLTLPRKQAKVRPLPGHWLAADP
jgi:copper chaperone CopZ